MRKYDKNRLFEMMNKVDKNFKYNKLNEEVNLDNIQTNDPNYISFEINPNSEDYNILKGVVDKGLNSEPFKKSQFGMRDYDNGETMAFFNFHITEKLLLLNYLNELYTETNNESVLDIINKIEPENIEEE